MEEPFLCELSHVLQSLECGMNKSTIFRIHAALTQPQTRHTLTCMRITQLSIEPTAVMSIFESRNSLLSGTQ